MHTKLLIVLLSFLVFPYVFAGDHLKETRYCGDPERTEAGKIKRSMATVKHFKELYPCIYPCDDTWRVDHVIPLAVGGCDSVSNMQWLPSTIKNCSGRLCKDRWERLVYPKNY
jgi:hypothetical protein